MDGPRIVVVGGGSYYSINLCESFVDYARDHLKGATVVLLDVKDGDLQVVESFAQRLAREVGAEIAFTATTSRARAFTGADFLLTTFRPGSHAQQELDETIPPRHGLQGNETVGIGGIFMNCRVAPVMRDLVTYAETLCPDATIVNYTNPTQHVADLVGRVSDMRAISLCDGYVELAESLAQFLGVQASDLRLYPAGTNHAWWLMRWTVAGRDGYEVLRERLDSLGEDELEALLAPPAVIRRRGHEYRYEELYKQAVVNAGMDLALRLFELYGLLPGPRYYWRYLLDQDAVIEEQRRPGYVTMSSFYTKLRNPRGWAALEQRLADASLQLRSDRRAQGGSHGDLAVGVIAALAADLDETFVVNVPNRGAIANLPDEAIVEVPARIDRRGAHPYAMGPLPKQMLGLQEALVLSQQLAVDAALSGSRETLLHAILAHPLVNSLDRAERCMDELLELQARWLPQFQKEMSPA
jgi:6-phospho-beta-glucosidase